MGVSGPVAAAILVAAAVAQGSAFLTAQRNAEGAVDQARDAWTEREEAVLHHDFGIDNAVWANGPKTVTLTVTNTGSVVLNASRVDVLFDGTRVTGSITSRQVDGTATGVWPPDSVLVLVVSSATRPNDAAVVSEWGRQDIWRGV